MNLFLLLDSRFRKAGALLRPHYGVHNLIKPGEMSNIIGLPDATVSVLNNWIGFGN